MTGVLGAALQGASVVGKLAQTLTPSRNQPDYVPYPAYDPYAGNSQPMPQPGPGYAQPGYAQPGYAQPGYAQPGYAQPGYAQPGYAQQGFSRQPYDYAAGYQNDMRGEWDRSLDPIANKAYTYGELKPYIDASAKKYGVDPYLIAGMLKKESTFTNWIHHKNPQAHGLIGVTENGMLPEFEAFASQQLGKKVTYGKGTNAKPLHPDLQIEFLAKKLDEIKKKHGLQSHQQAAGAWYLGDFAGVKNHLHKAATYQQQLQKNINQVKQGTP
ncbi:MAG: hypothetical protein WBV82_13170 [Myxococcaceae bacterium]